MYSTNSAVTAHANSVRFWKFPVSPMWTSDTVTADFSRYRDMAIAVTTSGLCHPKPVRRGTRLVHQAAAGRDVPGGAGHGRVEQYNYVNGLNRGRIPDLRRAQRGKPIPPTA